MLHRLCCLSLLLATGLACAAPKEESDIGRWLKSDKDNAPPPQEEKFDLPELAKLKEWRAYTARRSTGDNRLEIAVDSVTVGPDAILRYAIAVITPSGVRNTFFEGIDCYSGRYRHYAWATPENSWKTLESSRWHGATLNMRNAWQGEIITDFCATTGGPLPAATIQEGLRGRELPPKFR